MQRNWPGLQKDCPLWPHTHHKNTHNRHQQRHCQVFWSHGRSMHESLLLPARSRSALSTTTCSDATTHAILHEARNGISTEYNQHTTASPWYGAGQGASDACLHWITQANSMIIAYESLAVPWIISAPNHSSQFTQLIDAFIDDTSLISAAQWHQNFLELLQTLQRNLDIWHDLLQASGGMLNPSKCVWLCFHWKFSPNGTIKIAPPPTTTPPLQMTLWEQQPYEIRRLQPKEAHCYLSIYLTTDGNYKQELATYNNRHQTYAKLLTNCPFPHWEIHVIYKQCYLPTVSYPLPATVIPQPNSTKINVLPLPPSLPKWGTLVVYQGQLHMPL